MSKETREYAKQLVSQMTLEEKMSQIGVIQIMFADSCVKLMADRLWAAVDGEMFGTRRCLRVIRVRSL